MVNYFLVKGYYKRVGVFCNIKDIHRKDAKSAKKSKKKKRKFNYGLTLRSKEKRKEVRLTAPRTKNAENKKARRAQRKE